MSNKLLSPYKVLTQNIKIQLQPFQLNSNIENNMEIVLKKKAEKKCNKFGYIDSIVGIRSYNEGILVSENLQGSVSYDISYDCKMCIPIENTIIIGKIKAINQELIMAENGPIVIFIPKTNIDSNIWNASNEFILKKEGTKLKIEDYVKIFIEKKKVSLNNTKIKCIGKLFNFATPEEVREYFGNSIIENNESNNFIL